MNYLFQLLIVTFCCSEVCCNLLIKQDPEGGLELTKNILLPNNVNASLPQAVTELYVTMSPEVNITEHSKSSNRKRKRRRKNKKLSPLIPTPATSNFKNITNLPKKRIRGRNKKLRKNSKYYTITNTTKSTRIRSRVLHKKLNSKIRNGVLHQNVDELHEDMSEKYVPLKLEETFSKIKLTFYNDSNYSITTIKNQTKTSECTKKNGGCAHICLSKRKEKCECFKGFKLGEDKKNCIDINECTNGNGGCQMKCTNTVGSYKCHCTSGLRLSMDLRTCEDVNECLLRNGHGPCQDTCENSLGGYKCSCNHLKGTKLGNDLHTCVDVDECAEGNAGCSHICINTFGRSFCSCPKQMVLSSDFKTCQDLNECVDKSLQTRCPYGCINTEGSYRCMEASDLQDEESYNHIACKLLFPPKYGYFKCSRRKAIQSFTKSGRKRIKNGIGTRCILMCSEGYERVGMKFGVTCGLNGNWLGNLDSKCVLMSNKF